MRLNPVKSESSSSYPSTTWTVPNMYFQGNYLNQVFVWEFFVETVLLVSSITTLSFVSFTKIIGILTIAKLFITRLGFYTDDNSCRVQIVTRVPNLKQNS